MITGSASKSSTPISRRAQLRAGPMNMVTSSVSNFRMGLRSTWSMSSSATWCLRADSPIRITDNVPCLVSRVKLSCLAVLSSRVSVSSRLLAMGLQAVLDVGGIDAPRALDPIARDPPVDQHLAHGALRQRQVLRERPRREERAQRLPDHPQARASPQAGRGRRPIAVRGAWMGPPMGPNTSGTSMGPRRLPGLQNLA